MENLTAEQLIQEATKIITQSAQTPDDIKKLTQLRFFLAIQFRKTNMEGSAKEGLYNGERSQRTVELQESNPVGKAENMAKAEAEQSYGDYRAIQADASGIGKLLSAIEAMVISLQIEQKTINQVQC